MARRLYDNAGTDPATYDITYDHYGRADRHYTYLDGTTDTVIADFGYTYDKNSNITEISLDHRPSTPDNDYTYDSLNRLTDIEYLDNQNDTESFSMDKLGNRTGDQTLRDDGTIDFTVSSTTNRYTSIAGNNAITHDNAGNLTTDKDGYEYIYDYENRIVRIEDDQSTTIVDYIYDALNRRIEKYDAIADTTRHYYYNTKWQVISEYVDSSFSINFVFGNYIDEVLYRKKTADITQKYYVHDHLYSPVALIDYDDGEVRERYEYDAYGKVTFYRNNDYENTYTKSNLYNPYYFTGRRLDQLDPDEGDPQFEIMYYRNRYYDSYTGRFAQHDPLGIVPDGGMDNLLQVDKQYGDGLNIYSYVSSNPINNLDAFGLSTCHEDLLNCEGYCNDGDITCNRNCMKGKPKTWLNYLRCEIKCQALFMICSGGCDAIYAACLAKEGVTKVCKIVIGVGELIFDTMADALAWLASHPGEVVVGTLVVVAGVVMVVAMGPGGALVLVAA